MTCSPYRVIELPPEHTGGFAPRGAVRTLWKTRDFETVVSGPAETGKTWGCLQYVNALLWKYPGAQGVMCRKTYASLVGSALRTYRRILGPESPVRFYGGEKPEWADYPNGARLWIVGLDNPGKALSSERDFIYANQAEELALEDWETLLTRCTGRGAVMPYTRLFGDCNPGAPSHWIKVREREGKLRLLESRHEDNPTLFDEQGRITEQGRRSLSLLDNLSGTRYQRLRLGRWAQAEGAVYEDWDPALHVLDQMPAGWESWRKIRTIDLGYSNPFVCQWWAIGPDSEMIRYREIYRTKRLVEDHARDINRLSAGETYEATLADHDAEDRATLERYGIRTQKAHKAVSPGIQAVQQRLRRDARGKAGLYLLRGALVERDPELQAARKPTCTEEEFDCYLWPKTQDGKPLKEEPVKEHDHGLDALRYGVCYVDHVGSQPLFFFDTSDW